MEDLGFVQYRVRDHGGLARIEIASAELDRALERSVLEKIARGAREAGFKRVTLDMVGYRSGSLNPVKRSA